MSNIPFDNQWTVSDGADIVYRYRVNGSAFPTVALVHSLAMNQDFWSPVAERLSTKANVLTIDARGHGASTVGSGGMTAARMATDLAEVVEHLGLASVVVGGASMGGCIALQFAGDFAERTSGLALIDTTAWYGPSAPQDWEGRATKATAEGLASLVEFQKSRWFSDGFVLQNPGIVEQCVSTFLVNDLDHYAATCRMLGAFDGRTALAGIRVPTRVLVGDEDYAAPLAMAEALHEGIRNSRLRVIPGARHLTPLEVPDIVADALLELCAEASA